MYRGTTPTITINCDIDVSEFVTMWVTFRTQQAHRVGRKGRKSGEPAAETHDEQPSECLGAGSFEQNADQQRTRGIDRERTRRESQQRLPRHYPAGKQVTDDAAGSTAASYGQKFTNHKLNIRQILRICKFTEKMLTDCYFSCRFFEVFCRIGV